MSKTKCSCGQVIKAIQGSKGIKIRIAETLCVTRATLDTYLRRWATAKQAYDEECERVGDLAESVVYRNIELAQEQQDEGKLADTADAKWYLSRVRRGKYATRTEADVTSGGKSIFDQAAWAASRQSRLDDIEQLDADETEDA